VLLVLVIIPFLTSYLIRMYAWQFILQRNGLLNSLPRHPWGWAMTMPSSTHRSR